MNGGWIQMAGPQHRFFDFKDIEVNEFGGALQQVRFPPTRLGTSRVTRGTICSCCRVPRTSIPS